MDVIRAMDDISDTVLQSERAGFPLFLEEFELRIPQMSQCCRYSRAEQIRSAICYVLGASYMWQISVPQNSQRQVMCKWLKLPSCVSTLVH